MPHGKHVLEQGSQIVTCGNQAQALNPWQWERLGEMKAKGTQGGGSPDSPICSEQDCGQVAEVLLDYLW